MDVLTSRTEKRTKVLPFDVCCETILIKISTVFGFSKRVTEICAALIRETKQIKNCNGITGLQSSLRATEYCLVTIIVPHCFPKLNTTVPFKMKQLKQKKTGQNF